jgi:cytochrome bd ubiquinol oxidase subunit I
MEDLLAARAQMGMSLAFHIIFACVGIAMPLMMVVAEILWLKTGREVYLTLAKRWSKGTAVMFAVGAVSGTVLSFELGLLWPGFMGWAGAIIGMPFSLEGFAFFTEAIFLGVYLYGWKRVSANAHVFAGIVVALSGAASGIFVVIANAWMNTPAGFKLVGGIPTEIDPIAAMFNPNAFAQTLHMIIASYAATAFAVAGIHAWSLLRQKNNDFHYCALVIALVVASVSGLAEPLSGDVLARAVADNQPLKLAALEGQFKTAKSAPLRIGGIPDVQDKVTRYAIEIPYALSLLAFHNPDAVVKGLEIAPEKDWPPVVPVHLCFQAMVGAGSAMALYALLTLWLLFKRHNLSENRWFLKTTLLVAPLGFIAVECGWMVTELGRQPWVIYEIVRTADAVTSVPNLFVPFITFTLLYLFLAAMVIWLLIKQVAESPYYLRGGGHDA